MIIRIVKMSFAPQHVQAFTELFARQQQQIRHFPGCRHLELWRGQENGSVFFTYSHWDSPDALEQYRNSGLFHETWAATKTLFNAKPEAWSLERITDI